MVKVFKICSWVFSIVICRGVLPRRETTYTFNLRIGLYIIKVSYMTDTSCEKKMNSFLIQQIFKLQFQYLPWTSNRSWNMIPNKRFFYWENSIFWSKYLNFNFNLLHPWIIIHDMGQVKYFPYMSTVLGHYSKLQ
jgi:hypothetical protein